MSRCAVLTKGLLSGGASQRALWSRAAPSTPSVFLCRAPWSVHGTNTARAYSSEFRSFSKFNEQPRGDKACYNCGEKGHLARDCTEPRDTARVVCYRCGASGHTAVTCPQPKTCYRCGESGHEAIACPTHQPVLKCYRCGDEGHVVADCPRATTVCYVCQEEGHLAADCPSGRKSKPRRNDSRW